MKEYYTIAETAKILKLANSTIRKYLANGRLGGAKIGRAWRISEADIDAFVAANHSGQSDAGEAKGEGGEG